MIKVFEYLPSLIKGMLNSIRELEVLTHSLKLDNSSFRIEWYFIADIGYLSKQLVPRSPWICVVIFGLS